MRLDVVQLSRFYAGPLGPPARVMIKRRLKALWPDLSGCDVLALGYATPFAEVFRKSARRVVAAMPAAQGVQRWPSRERNAAALVEESCLPFREALFDRAVVAHLIEESESLRTVLRELWRVTAPEARIVIIAANRRGLWSQIETSPFGHGRSFTRGQLARVLRNAMFEPVAWARALYLPPIAWGPAARGAPAWERVGERFWPALGGVTLVEAVKHVVSPTPGRRSIVFAPEAAPARRTPAEALEP